MVEIFYEKCPKEPNKTIKYVNGKEVGIFDTAAIRKKIEADYGKENAKQFDTFGVFESIEF